MNILRITAITPTLPFPPPKKKQSYKQLVKEWGCIYGSPFFTSELTIYRFWERISLSLVVYLFLSPSDSGRYLQTYGYTDSPE